MISVLIPTYNNGSTLRACLESISNQTLKADEIVIIDGHSKDDTIAIAKEFNCKIMYESGGSRASACNVGVEEAIGDYIVFTDSDVVAKEDWLEQLMKGFEEIKDDSIVCVTGPNIDYPNETKFGLAVKAIYNTFIGGSWSEQAQSIFNDKPRYVKSAAGCNVAYKKEKLLEIMPFNEKLITTEDTDINYKLLQKGYKLYFYPSAIVLHQRPQNHRSYRNKSFKYALGKVQFYRAHKTGLEFWHLIPPFYFMGLFFLIFASFASFWFLFIIAGYVGLYLLTLLLTSIVQGIKYKQKSYPFLLPIMFIEGHLWWSMGILKEIFNGAKDSENSTS